ncbi:hypothetical protein KSI86_14685 [Dickeya oryzae]|uniref:hypothetical protein n=1 Tax=Dickeya oryzae TaxID=1240404 RepID=UPI002097EA1F|nr:hypothetical protein [Dickeya oryzae]MCO7255406.1 hypothetical protein [Dickeya oryzae]
MDNYQLYKKVLGINVKKLISVVQNIHKMSWEQVLLLALYSRQQYFTSEDGVGFSHRIQLVHKALHHSDLCKDVLTLLHQKMGSNEIVKMLLNHESSQASVLLRDMEQNNIAFACERHKHPYSYYAMYSILHNPLSVFQKLTIFDRLSTTIPAFIVHTYQETYSDVLLFTDKEHPLFDSSLSLNGFIEILEKNNTKINLEIFPSQVKGRMAQTIGKYLKEAFEQLIWRGQAAQKGYEPVSLFSEMCTAKRDHQQFRLDFDIAKLENLINLGQIEGVTEGVKAEVLKAFGKQPPTRLFGQPNYSDSAGELDALSNWYGSVNTGLIKKIEQIPRLIASILDFDLRYRIGIGSDGFGLVPMTNFKFNLTSKDYYHLATGIIHHTLYRLGNSYDLQNPLRVYTKVDQYLANILKTENEPSETSALMSTWADLASAPMIERFKKLPHYLKPHKKIEVISRKIDQQRARSRDDATPYPINSLFPLPLWAHLID